MPLLLPSLGSGLRCSSSSAHHSDNRHPTGDVKGMLSFLRGSAHPAVPGPHLSSSGSSHHSGSAGKACVRHALTPRHQDATPSDGTSPPDAAAAAPDAATTVDAEWDAVRLMTAATILSSSSSSTAASGSPLLSHHDDDSSSLAGSSTVSMDSSYDELDLAPLAVLDGVQALDAESLALAVGILRQHQPLDANEEDGVQLSERLRDLLMLLRRRPASSGSSSSIPTASAAAADAGFRAAPAAAGAAGAAAAAEAGTGHSAAGAEDDGFWAGQDEWSDVRSALMGIGIDASLDEEDEEDVWALEAGRFETRRTRLLRSLPRLDSNAAQQLTAFLAELQQHTAGDGPDSHQPGTSSSSSGSSAQAEAAAEADAAAGHAAQAVSEEEEQWWQQAALAYSLLKQQAGKVKAQVERQQATAAEAEVDVLAVEQQ